MRNGGNFTNLSRRNFLAVAAATAAAVGVPAIQASPADSTRPAPPFRFAAAFPPLAEYLFPSDEWLAAISDAGYTHCILTNDPFSHHEDIRVVDRIPTIFDMTAGWLHRGYLAWLRGISEAVARHNLKLGLELWEPVLPDEARRLLPVDWRGPAAESGETLCVSQPDARAWFLKAIEMLLQAAPQMDAIAWGIYDGDIYTGELCDSTCPRCSGKPMAVRLGELYRDIQKTCQRVRPGFQSIMYDWFWEDDFFQAVFSRVEKGTPILTRLERGASYTPDPAHPEWSGHVFDQSLGCDAVGTDFARAQQVSGTYGGPVYVMPSLSGMFEGSLLPYVPAVQQVAKKFDRMRREKVTGWVDFDCGGIHKGLMLDLVQVVQRNPRASLDEWLQLLAERRYGPAAGIGREAWDNFDQAVRLFPAVLDFGSIRDFAGRFGDSIDLTVVHPFIPERARQGKDLGETHYFYDPHNFLTPEAIPPVRSCLSKALMFARKGKIAFDRLTEAAAPAVRGNAEFDAHMAELTVLAWESALNFYKWGAAVQGDKSVPVSAVLHDEIYVTSRYRELQLRPDLEVGNITTAWQLEVVNSVPELVPELFSWNTSESTGTADLFELKIRGLERLLKD